MNTAGMQLTHAVYLSLCQTDERGKAEDANKLQAHVKKNDQTDPTIQRNLMQRCIGTIENYLKDVTVSNNLLCSRLSEHQYNTIGYVLHQVYSEADNNQCNKLTGK